MQQPTLQNVRVRSTRDALQIFYAVARRSLPLITRRLDAEERRAIVPGNVYVWEERSANSEATGLGMERWSVSSLSHSSILVNQILQDGRHGLGTKSSSRCMTCPPSSSRSVVTLLSQEFLFYHQKEYDLGDDSSNATAPWAQMIRWVCVSFSAPPAAQS